MDKAGIEPVFICDATGIAATRQAEGDIEYLFAVNASPDPGSAKRNAMKAATATIAIEAKGKTLYDAMTGGAAEAKAKYGFIPGQMRVFARTARPIGAVSVATPSITHDLTQARNPITLRLAATVLDTKGGVLSDSAPLRIQVLDPKGATRYDLHRATKLGRSRSNCRSPPTTRPATGRSWSPNCSTTPKVRRPSAIGPPPNAVPWPGRLAGRSRWAARRPTSSDSRATTMR